MAALAGGMGVFTERARKAEAQVARATRGMPSPKIKDVQVIATQPASARLTIVKIVTDQDGLYGYGCGTFTQRADLVNAAVEKYLKPFLIGKPADRIDDTWQACYNSSYWRNGPVLYNAISGVDEALWDIKGRQAGMPVYDVLGGKCREAADTYVHVSGPDNSQIIESCRRFMEQGFRNLRLQASVPGMADTTGPGMFGRTTSNAVRGLHEGRVFESAASIPRALKCLEECRKQLGEEVGLLYDVHERLTPNEAVQFAKDVEHLKLFFLEDPLAPEDIAYFRQIRQQCATPLAMGELFTSPHEWTTLIQERLIDYMRMHLSDIGGLTPARKAAAMGEIMGVKTAWHGPGDVSPIGHAAQLALDLSCYNFGIQEHTPFNDRVREVFKGCPEVKNGYMYANEAPGWGMEVDEKLAAKYPYGASEQGEDKLLNGGFGEIRRRDGTIIKQ
jgi:mannonate dehydratase